MSAQVRILIHPPQSASMNMAVDEALLRFCQLPVLRFYQWSEPAITIGYFQSHKVVPAGRPFARRYTGGGLVDHANDFTYTLVLPPSHPLYQAGTSVSYEKIHQAVSKGLTQLGLLADLAPQILEGDSTACFQKPVKFDVISGTQKLAGAAQRRIKGGCLHQGSILIPSPDFERIHQTLTPLLCEALNCPLQFSEMTPEENRKAQELHETRYSTEAWNKSR